MISIQFNLKTMPLSQICDTARQLLRQGEETFARVAVKQPGNSTIYFIDMQKFPSGNIYETMWNVTGESPEDAKHNHVEGVDTLHGHG